MRTGILLVGGLLTGCSKKAYECGDVAVSDDNRTVGELTFDTNVEGTSWVTYKAGGQQITTPAVGPTTVHDHTLLGLPADTTVDYTVTVDYDGDEVTCEGSVKTGLLPPTFPPFEITVNDPSGWDEPYLMAAMLGDPKVLAVINRGGEVLWYMYATDKLPFLEANFEADQIDEEQVGIVHAALWPEQGQIVYNLQSQEFSKDIGSMLWTNWKKEDLRTEILPQSHHAFALHHDTGTVGYMKLDYRDWYDPDLDKKVQVVGDAEMEIDTDGNITEIWNAWDELEVVKHNRWDISFYPGAHDWTHGNAINYHPETDSYLFSFAHINTIVEYFRDGTTGRVFDWQGWDFPNGDPFAFQHDPRINDDGTITMTSTNQTSMAIAYEIDDANKTLTKVWSHGEDDDVYTFALGENHLLDNGNYLVNFGSAATLREVTPEGEVVWELVASPNDIWFGAVIPFSDFYTME